MIKYTFLLSFFLLFSGCDADIFNTKKVENLKNEKEQLKQQLTLEQERKKMELEKQKLSAEAALKQEQLKQQTELEKAKLQAKQAKELELIRQKTLLEKEKNQNELLKYALLLLALLLAIAAFFLYLYLKHRREDKLRAYNDNLKKYFLLKENEMKLKMTEKVLETIKEGHLSKEDQHKLIAAFSASTAKKVNDDDIDLIEEK